jgi:hypothetical protein
MSDPSWPVQPLPPPLLPLAPPWVPLAQPVAPPLVLDPAAEDQAAAEALQRAFLSYGESLARLVAALVRMGLRGTPWR